jgi:hypothetical protein
LTEITASTSVDIRKRFGADMVNDPDGLRQRASRYERLAARMIDDQAKRALCELAAQDRRRADELSPCNPAHRRFLRTLRLGQAGGFRRIHRKMGIVA